MNIGSLSTQHVTLRWSSKVLQLLLNLPLLGNESLDVEPVWNIVEDVRSYEPNNFQVPRPSTSGMRDTNNSKEFLMSVPQYIPFCSYFIQFLLQVTIYWVMSQFMVVGVLNYVVDGHECVWLG
jgi:hypothetical protein